jgi:hydrogenase nickel incorporation protein HypA/HybF
VHEVSIALGMVDELIKIANENKATKINSVKLKIGKMSGIVTDSLIFAFDAVKLEHSLLSDAEIVIDEIPTICECEDCNTSFEIDNMCFPACSNCESLNVKIISGEEQHIENVELEV